jgi:two-component system sensor histidine kinase KdpD
LIDSDRRPSPDALLALGGKQGHGKLKIFLGAAPGVGKTFEMLTVAQGKRREHIDVVVGIVETHGRAETLALLDGLEVVPRREVEYRGRMVDEMDLDAVLARRPALVLVDELAHTNAEGSRHPKRYLDVQELLSAGIDVYTTLNIQHLESLNDVVAGITRIRVRETVPDSIIDQADEIEVIDLTPQDLIQRLKDGKVYLPAQATRAAKHYFQPGNLAALRELALRRTAQRVDDQMVDYMRSHAISGPWGASDRVLVLIDGAPDSIALVRHARRIADNLRGPWTAIHIEGGGWRELARQPAITEALRLAERLGGDTVTVPGNDMAAAVVEYARSHNFTHIIVPSPKNAGWTGMFVGSTAHRIIGRAGGIHVHVLAEERPQDLKGGAAGRPFALPTLSGSAVSALIVAASVGLAMLLREMMGLTSVALILLMGVLASAVAYGLGASLLACLLSVLAYNFFFLPPLYTFTISNPENILTLGVFAGVAVVASNLTARMRTQTVTAQERARTTEELYRFSRKLAGAVSLDDVLWATVHQVALMLSVRVVLLLPGEEGLTVQAGFPPDDLLDAADLAAAKWAWQHNKPAGRGADTLPGGKRLFLPMQTGRGPIGIFGIDRDEPGVMLTPDGVRLLNALSDQAAIAIERVNLVRDVDRARLQAETDRLRSALLTSISHDLRTPLASIMGSVTSLTSRHGALDEAGRADMLKIIQEEAERLNRFIGNLLDMTRLESGPLPFSDGLADISDLVGAVLRRAERILAHHTLQVDLQPGLPMLRIDMVLMEQVLFNLLDNAAKYSPANSNIALRAWHGGEFACLQIMDEGDGLPPDDLERIFEKFYRVRSADRQRAGTGLGLAICRGFVEAMGGTITAGNRTDRTGAVFLISLPVPAQPSLEEEEAA